MGGMKLSSGGLFVAIEGLDKSGKTTIVKSLKAALSKVYPVTSMSFPDRSTSIGYIIDKYLKGVIKMNPETIHLLFTADRYDKKDLILEKSKDSILICDRYSWSGITSTVAKGVDLGWCVETERLHPKADLTLYLNADVPLILTRRGFGDEVFETIEFQEKIKDVFNQMKDYNENVVVLDASKSVEELTMEAVEQIKKCLELKSNNSLV